MKVRWANRYAIGGQQLDSELAIGLTNDMLWTAASSAFPVLLASMVVGLLISVFQVVTQIQEMTLTFVPKMLAIVIVLWVFGPWMLYQLTNYAETLFRRIPDTF